MYYVKLMQTGKLKEDFKNIEITGPDSIMNWTLMGAAEYEFGALPDSLKRVGAHLSEYGMYEVDGIKSDLDEQLWVFCLDKDKEKAIETAKELCKEKMEFRIKCFGGFYRYLKAATEHKRISAKKRTNKDDREFLKYFDINYDKYHFGWDPDNDFFVMFGDDLKDMWPKAMQAYLDKHPELLPPPPPKGFFQRIFSKK